MIKFNRDLKDFRALRILLASDDDVMKWSHGEVKEPETINYRTERPEADGLMCEKIFGPTKNFHCYCGKYRKPRYKGIICDKCGVEVTHSKVRRERMGHIKLVVPIVHLWYFHSIPSKLSIILDMKKKDLESIVYYSHYVVVEINEDEREKALAQIDEYEEAEEKEIKDYREERLEELKKEEEEELEKLEEDVIEKEKFIVQENMLKTKFRKRRGRVKKEANDDIERLRGRAAEMNELVEKMELRTILTDEENLMLQRAGVDFYEAKIGGAAIQHILENFDAKAEAKKLRRSIVESAGRKNKKKKRRLKYVSSMAKNDLDPTAFMIQNLPVIPPDLRPIISLPGGRHAVSDLNDLYRRVINRNNRLKRLMEIKAPEVILRNEKRMLQEAVDSLIDNQHTSHKPVLNSRRLPYKSLADQLTGKKGRFRKNLLGKRVDYSGRAVIIGDPSLKLNQCGLPYDMALELFKPFVINQLLEHEDAINIQEAKQMVAEERLVIWDRLEEVLEDHPVILNRPPTLHKQNLQGFFVRLVEGDAIRIHPLICGGYNADFDGDQMGVFVPLSKEAREEVKNSMLPRHNILKLSSGESIISVSKDLVWGIYYMTEMNEDLGKHYIQNPDTAIGMFENEQIELQAPLVTRIDGKAIETTVGRLIFNEALVDEVEYLNEHMTKGKMGDLVSRMREIADLDDVVKTLDKIKELTLQYGTKSGFSMSKSDLMSYSGKEEGVGEAEQKEKEIIAQYENGLLTEEEKDKLIQRLWLDTTEDLLNKAWDELKQDEENATYLHIKAKMNGTLDHVKQVCAIKGLVKDPTGTWVNLPIKANYTEGLSVFDFFIASKGGRKGLADTALRTADSGYLTRKLVDVAHSSIIRMEDCGYEEEGIEIKRESNRKLGFVQTMKGRVLAQDVKVKKKVIAKKGDFVDMELANKIDKSGVDSVWIRSLLTCQAPKGLCSKCYGADMGTNELVEVGKAVGVIAAQAIGELSTQMTLRTFHFGGSKEKDITQGLPKIIELFEARDPKFEAEIAEVDGVVKVKPGKAKTTILVEGVKKWHKDYLINDVKEISVEDGDKVSVGDELYQIDEDDIVTATKSGTVSIKGNLLRLSSDKVSATQEVQVSNEVDILVESGDEVKAGDPLTEGSVSAEELMETRSMLDAQLHTLEELQEVYLDQAISIHDKHLEVIIREMGRAAKVLEPGDSDYVVDEIGNRHLMDLKNEVLVEEGKTPIAYRPVMLGITKASLNREGILSPLSFQEQVKTLTSVSLKGDIDYLNGLKENVIIGRLIPHGDRAHIEDPKSMHEVTDMLDGPPKS